MEFIRRLFKKNNKSKDQQKKSDPDIMLRSLTDAKKYARFNNNITEYNFIQGNVGNCGTIAAMASLATNHEIFNKVFQQSDPINKAVLQSGPISSNPSQLVFNLFKSGKSRRVVVDDCLPFLSNELYSSSSWNDNFVGALLEKALIKLHFDGKYESSEGFDSSISLTSFSNTIIESFSVNHPSLCYSAHDFIKHGVSTKSLMVVTFKSSSHKYGLYTQHQYTLTDMSKEFVKLYNPHGETLLVPKYCFFDCLRFINICYFENRVFEMLEIKTLTELTECWCPVENKDKFLCIELCLLVEEDHTDLVINFLGKPGLKLYIKCFKAVGNEWVCDHETPMLYTYDGYRSSFGSGAYVIVFRAYGDKNIDIFDEIWRNLEEDENKMFFRFASSKHFTIEKYDENNV